MLCLFVFSCKKDKSSTVNASITGKWTVTSNISTYYNKAGVVTGSDDYTADEKTFTFNSDGTIAQFSPNDTRPSTYALITTAGKKQLAITTLVDGNSPMVDAYDVITLTDHNLELKGTFRTVQQRLTLPTIQQLLA